MILFADKRFARVEMQQGFAADSFSYIEIDGQKTQRRTSPSGLVHVLDQQQQPSYTHRHGRGTIEFSIYRNEHATEWNVHHAHVKKLHKLE